VPRKEDPTLLRGQGRYTTTSACRAGVRGHGAEQDRARHPEGHRCQGSVCMPGVLAILTSADLDAAGFGRSNAR